MRPRLAVITPLFAPGVRGGGPIRTLTALVQGAPTWLDLHVFTQSRDHGERQDMVDITDRPTMWEGTKVTYARAHTVRGLGALYAGLVRWRPDVIYLNSYWSLFFSQGVMAIHRCGLFGRAVVVIAPRGEFAPAALNRHSTRKALMRWGNQLCGSHRSVIWHASSVGEADDIRRYIGPVAPVVIRENDSLLPARAEPVTDSTPASGRGALRAVFLGRLVEHKGPDLAAEAVAALDGEVTLDIYGPAEDEAFTASLRCLAESTDGRIRIRGTLSHDDVRATLSGYEVLVLPTRSENFGHVIAEALSVGVPVVVPDVTPWTSVLETGGAGRVVERSAAAIRSALQELADMSEAEVIGTRRAAASAYDDWRRASLAAPHLFDLLRGRGLFPDA